MVNINPKMVAIEASPPTIVTQRGVSDFAFFFGSLGSVAGGLCC
jgi:acetyl-CoA carboxylase beta subunit